MTKHSEDGAGFILQIRWLKVEGQRHLAPPSALNACSVLTSTLPGWSLSMCFCPAQDFTSCQTDIFFWNTGKIWMCITRCIWTWEASMQRRSRRPGHSDTREYLLRTSQQLRMWATRSWHSSHVGHGTAAGGVNEDYFKRDVNFSWNKEPSE